MPPALRASMNWSVICCLIWVWLAIARLRVVGVVITTTGTGCQGESADQCRFAMHSEAIPEFRMFVSSSSPRRFAGCTDDGA
jgi:hypothetical protein